MHKVMEFILPILSASGEAVIFTLIVGVLFVIGRGRIQPSEKTLFIERPGQYRMVLAPGLNLAQPFVEAIARQLAAVDVSGQENQQLHFEIHDKEVATKRQPAYLLAISCPGGILSFEATCPMAGSAVSSPAQLVGSSWAGNVEEAMRSVAQPWGINFTRLEYTSASLH